MPGMHILYVEDDAFIRGEIADMLANAGFDVTSCGSAEEARRLLDGRSFDLLMTDVGLAGASGLELARHWVGTSGGRPCVLCSGYELDAASLFHGAPVRAIMKPFEEQDLVSLVHDLLATAPEPATGRHR